MPPVRMSGGVPGLGEAPQLVPDRQRRAVEKRDGADVRVRHDRRFADPLDAARIGKRRDVLADLSAREVDADGPRLEVGGGEGPGPRETYPGGEAKARSGPQAT